jgi:hypothetical protein
MQMRIVADDPRNVLFEGTVISPELGRALALEGVVSLPHEPEVRLQNGAAGFAMRRWGAGVQLQQVPGRFCPVAIFCFKGRQTVHWAMKFVGPVPAEGYVRLAADAYQMGTSALGFGGSGAMVRTRDFEAIEPQFRDVGTYVVQGQAEINSPHDQLVGLSGYGHGLGMSCRWLAVSTAPL